MELNESRLAKTQRQKGGCFYTCRALLLFALALGYASFAIRSSKDVKRALDNLSADFKDTNRKIDSNLEYLKQRDVVRELKMTSFGGKTESNPKTTSPSVPSSLKDSINANLKQGERRQCTRLSLSLSLSSSPRERTRADVNPRVYV